MNRRIFPFAVLLLLILVSCRAGSRPESPLTSDSSSGVPHGSLSVRIISDSWLCIVGDYLPMQLELLEKRDAERLEKLERDESTPGWALEFAYRYAMWDIIEETRGRVKEAFEDPEHFSITADGAQVNIERSAYWTEAIEQLMIPRFSSEGVIDGKCSHSAHFAYLELSEPLKIGDTYQLSTSFGEELSFTYDQQSLSYALKVNQEGYQSDAPRAYGYLGLWLSSAGALDVDPYVGSPFYLVDERDQSIVYEGRVEKRSDVQVHHTAEGKAIPVDGEEVAQLEFSGFSTPGEYHLYLPGVGRSHSFIIAEDAIGYSYYTHMRGLYHQRSGIEKGLPYTGWEMGAGHTVTYEGAFAPDDRQYRLTDGSYGFFDSEGRNIAYDPFTMVADTATERVIPGLYGGWYDAGDFDRRSYHFQIVEDLVSVYLMAPEKYPDGQLQIPESGNGIPDLLDEAAWGIELWYRAQREDGGLGCWIEADSHPRQYDPALDPQRYYAALPTRGSTLEYALHAALLSLSLRQAGALKESQRYLASAVKAFSWARDPQNRAELDFTHEEDGRIESYRYIEPEELDETELFLAAAYLYLLTGNQSYELYIGQQGLEGVNSRITDASMVYRLLPLYLLREELPSLDFDGYVTRVIELAEPLLESQRELAYRTFNWPLDHGYFTFMAWGRGLPYYRGRALIAAWRITSLELYREAALLLVDWMQGANSLGRSLTTGLGDVYPVNLLSLPSIADGIDDPIPGITVFTYSGTIDRWAKELVYAMRVEGRKVLGGRKIDFSLLPDELKGGRELSAEEEAELLEGFLPIYRRHTTLEHLIVSQNEFTVWETIGPAAAFTAALLPADGWMPPEGLLQRPPAEKKSELEGYIPQP